LFLGLFFKYSAGLIASVIGDERMNVVYKHSIYPMKKSINCIQSDIGMVAAFLFLMVGTLFSEELRLNVEEKEAPKSVSDEIRASLSNRTVQLLDGEKPVFEFWFRKTLPLEKKPESSPQALKSIKVATLIGVVKVHESKRDYRDDDLYDGVHTMRFGIIPEDGNHLGASQYPYFVLLTSCKIDLKLGGFKSVKELIKASSEDTASEHPMVMSLWPVSLPLGDLPALKEPAAPDHKSVRIKLPGLVEGLGDAIDVVIDIVYEGMGDV